VAALRTNPEHAALWARIEARPAAAQSLHAIVVLDLALRARTLIERGESERAAELLRELAARGGLDELLARPPAP